MAERGGAPTRTEAAAGIGGFTGAGLFAIGGPDASFSLELDSSLLASDSDKSESKELPESESEGFN